jgi:hypothetical protein
MLKQFEMLELCFGTSFPDFSSETKGVILVFAQLNQTMGTN